MKTLTLKRGDKKGAETAVMIRKRRHVVIPERKRVNVPPVEPDITTNSGALTKKADVKKPGAHRKIYPLEDALCLLHSLWPALFSAQIDTCRPMKLGLLEDLCLDADARNISISKKIMKRLLRTIVYQDAYKKMIICGAIRYDAKGQPAGCVSEEESSYSLKCSYKTGIVKSFAKMNYKDRS